MLNGMSENLEKIFMFRGSARGIFKIFHSISRSIASVTDSKSSQDYENDCNSDI